MRDTWQKLALIYIEARKELQEEYKKEDQSTMFDEAFKSGLRFPEGTPEETGNNYNS